MVRQCRVYRSFDVDSDHFPVLATLKLKLKRSTQPQTKHFIPNLSSFSNIDVSREYAANVSSKLKATSLEDQTLEAMLSILLQERFLENLCVPRNHGYPRLLLLLLISTGKLFEGEM